MKRIAILTCWKWNERCTGALCLKVFNNRSQYFSRYKDEAIELAAFWRCNGCDIDFRENAGMQEKIARILKEKIDVVHVGLCTQLKNEDNPEIRIECEEITRICRFLEERGIEIVRGTHK